VRSNQATWVGIRPGGVIVAVGKLLVAEFRVATKEADLARGIRLQVQEEGRTRFVFLKARQE
jgi:hypothetical protein